MQGGHLIWKVERKTWNSHRFYLEIPGIFCERDSFPKDTFTLIWEILLKKTLFIAGEWKY